VGHVIAWNTGSCQWQCREDRDGRPSGAPSTRRRTSESSPWQPQLSLRGLGCGPGPLPSATGSDSARAREPASGSESEARPGGEARLCESQASLSPQARPAGRGPDFKFDSSPSPSCWCHWQCIGVTPGRRGHAAMPMGAARVTGIWHLQVLQACIHVTVSCLIGVLQASLQLVQCNSQRQDSLADSASLRFIRPAGTPAGFGLHAEVH